MEDNIILKNQISIEEALSMVGNEVVEKQEEEKEGFKVINRETADWCLKMIKEYEEEHESVNKYADEEINKLKDEIAKVNKWREEELKHYDTTFFEVKLKEYYVEQRELNPKFRLTTPNGTVSTRKTTKPNWIDEEAIINYLKENHSAAIRVKEEIDKAAFKKMYPEGVNHETGEIIPGYEIKVVESFSIKTK